MSHVLTGNVNNHFWVGSVQSGKDDNKFYWLNGNRMANNLWAAGEPNFHFTLMDMGCACTYSDEPKFVDTSCGSRHAYACEKGNYLAATTVDFH